jgi:hypothetical protein
MSIALILALFCAFFAISGTAAGKAEPVEALPTASAVFVNHVSVTFQAYNIGGYNYFKLRDLAKALEGRQSSLK